jgi:hypothetical protein
MCRESVIHPHTVTCIHHNCFLVFSQKRRDPTLIRIDLEKYSPGLAAVVVVSPLLIMGVRLAEDGPMRPSKAKRDPGIRAAYHIISFTLAWNLEPLLILGVSHNGNAPSTALIR